jgi:hypothetical protein
MEAKLSHGEQLLGSKKIALSALVIACLSLLAVTIYPATAQASTNPVSLGALANASIFSNAPMCNDSTSVVSGDVNVATGPSVLGISLPLGITIGGVANIANGITAQAKVDLTGAINLVRSLGAKVSVAADVSGKVLTPGTYTLAGLKLNGTLTLNGLNDPNAVFILYVNGNANIGAGSLIKLINKANSAHVFIVVNGTAAIGANATLAGKLLSVGDIGVGAHAKVYGSLLSQNGGVCLNADVVNSTPLVGASVDVGVTTPAVPTTHTGVTTTTGGGATPQAEDPGVIPSDTSDAAAASDDNGALVEGSALSATPQTKSSTGVLAFTGRNALGLTTGSLAILAIGEGIYLFVLRKKMNTTL